MEAHASWTPPKSASEMTDKEREASLLSAISNKGAKAMARAEKKRRADELAGKMSNHGYGDQTMLFIGGMGPDRTYGADNFCGDMMLLVLGGGVGPRGAYVCVFARISIIY